MTVAFNHIHHTTKEGLLLVKHSLLKLKDQNPYDCDINKNVYIDQLDEVVDKYNKTYRTIKVKLTDDKLGSYIEYGVEHKDKDPKFKVGDHVIISKNKNIFAKGYTPNCSEEGFVIPHHGHTLSVMIMLNRLLETFMKKIWKRQVKNEFCIEK